MKPLRFTSKKHRTAVNRLPMQASKSQPEKARMWRRTELVFQFVAMQ
jgi:hypothetical protein